MKSNEIISIYKSTKDYSDITERIPLYIIRLEGR